MIILQENIKFQRFKYKFLEQEIQTLGLYSLKKLIFAKYWRKYFKNTIYIPVGVYAIIICLKRLYAAVQNSRQQLFPAKARCWSTQHMPNKTNKFEIKFWLASDSEMKYVVNGLYMIRHLTFFVFNKCLFPEW